MDFYHIQFHKECEKDVLGFVYQKKYKFITRKRNIKKSWCRQKRLLENNKKLDELVD